MYGEQVVSEGRTQEGFARFRSGNFDGHLAITVKIDEIVVALNICHMTIWNYLRSAGYKGFGNFCQLLVI